MVPTSQKVCHRGLWAGVVKVKDGGRTLSSAPSLQPGPSEWQLC